MSEHLRNQLIEQEGERLEMYLDSRGFWTIGVGRLLDNRRGGKISHQEAIYMLDNDIYRARADVDKAFPWSSNLTPARYDVLCNMAFNMGLPTLKGFVKMLAAAQAGDFDRASDEMLNSRWSRQVGIRAAVLSAQMRSGRYA